MAPGFPDYGAIAAQLEVDTVLVDNRHGAHAAVQHLIGYGHRRIGYLGDREDIWAVRERPRHDGCHRRGTLHHHEISCFSRVS
jgi:DNA-binding LacI/PurR family transcriptional regulator